MQNKTNAIILNKIPYGEADLIVTFFGREEGKTAGIAKNARLSQRRFGAALELGSVATIGYSKRPSAELVSIEHATLEFPMNGITKSLKRIAALMMTLELAREFLPERQPAQEKFDLLSDYILSLTKNDPTCSSFVSFELNWLALVGYKPSFGSCVRCRVDEGAQAVWFFSHGDGGILCHACFKKNKNAVKLNSSVVGAIRDWEAGREISGPSARFVYTALIGYVSHILRRPLATASLIKGW